MDAVVPGEAYHGMTRARRFKRCWTADQLSDQLDSIQVRASASPMFSTPTLPQASASPMASTPTLPQASASPMASTLTLPQASTSPMASTPTLPQASASPMASASPLHTVIATPSPLDPGACLLT